MGIKQDLGFGDLPSALVSWVMPANTLLRIFIGVVPKWVTSISPAQPQGFDPSPDTNRSGIKSTSSDSRLAHPSEQICIQGPQKAAKPFLKNTLLLYWQQH